MNNTANSDYEQLTEGNDADPTPTGHISHDAPLKNECRMTPFGVIIPEEGSWKLKWDIFVLLLIIYSSVIIPFRISFLKKRTLRAACGGSS